MSRSAVTIARIGEIVAAFVNAGSIRDLVSLGERQWVKRTIASCYVAVGKSHC